MAIPNSRALLDRLETDGYVVIPRVFSDSEIASLRTHAERVACSARSGQWPFIRTVPKQFPPWPSPDPASGKVPDGGIWGVQHLLHPDIGDGDDGAARNAFAECYFGDALLNVVKALLLTPDDRAAAATANATATAATAANPSPNNGHSSSGRGGCGRTNGATSGGLVNGVSDDDKVLVMELFNMLVDPPTDFELRWHRDAVPFDIERAEESKRLDLFSSSSSSSSAQKSTNGNGSQRASKRRAYHAQYNIPLYEDSSLELVPGSHVRVRTDVELDLLSQDPYTPKLPGMIQVQLKPGDIAFYDNDIIHRGVYKAGIPRLTLHGSVGDVRGGSQRAANVLQHAVGQYVDRCDFGADNNNNNNCELWSQSRTGISEGDRERLRKRAENMKRNLVWLGSMYRDDVYLHQG